MSYHFVFNRPTLTSKISALMDIKPDIQLFSNTLSNDILVFFVDTGFIDADTVLQLLVSAQALPDKSDRDVCLI